MKMIQHRDMAQNRLLRSHADSFMPMVCFSVAVAFIAFSLPTFAQESTEEVAPTVTKVDMADITSKSSSHISADMIEPYIQGQTAQFVINTRKMDPFGQVQDPSVKKVVKENTTGPRRFKPIKPTSFSDVISRIKVNTIMPSENKFLIGTRSFKKGDQFPIAHRGKKLTVEVVEVTATNIDFENVSTGEIASVKLNMLPAGMESGTAGILAPGMEQDDNSAPLQLGPGN